MSEGPSFNALRNAAHARAEEVGMPSTRHEDWRYVDLKGFEADLPAATERGELHLLPVARTSLPGFVIGNGFYDPRAASELPDADLHVDLLAGDNTARPDLLAGWSRQLDSYDDITACWTLADMRSALAMRVEGRVDQPLVLVDVATDGASAFRTRLELARDASLELLILHLVGDGARSSLGIEVACEPGSHLAVDEIEIASEQLGHPGELFVHKWIDIADGARVDWVGGGSGGRLVRHRADLDLRGPGSECNLALACLAEDRRQAHHLVRATHHAGGSRSRQLVKNVAGGRALISFDGLVTMVEGADGAEADQTCRSLQLSDRARICARPQLDIRTDDVIAAHGATIGRPDRDEIDYLRSRGIDGADAGRLLVDGFFAEIVDGLRIEEARSLAKDVLTIQDYGVMA